jgi:hypothetical protein
MPLPAETKALLSYLQRNPLVRAAIRADPDQTVVYCGKLIEPAWIEFKRMKKTLPELAHRKLLPEILESVQTPGAPFPNLFAWVQSMDALSPKETTSFLAWRVVSGIMCANAIGKVSFIIGNDIDRKTKVFAATEVWALSSNTKLDATTKELISYYKDRILSGHTDFGITFIAG